MVEFDLNEYKNQEIPLSDYVFRRVSLNHVVNSLRLEHKLKIHKDFFKNDDGTGMSVDWERICSDPVVTQTRDNREKKKFGVIVFKYKDLRDFFEKIRIISDQEPYDCHCSLTGMPMSMNDFRKKKKEKYKRMDKEVETKIRKLLFDIREKLLEIAFWLIPLNIEGLTDNEKELLKEPPSDFDYAKDFTSSINSFFLSRNHRIPNSKQ